MKKINKNIGLLTFHRAYNYGAVLQCYALKQVIQELSINCEVIDYWPKYFKNIYYLKCERSIQHPHITYSIKKMKVRKILNKRNENFEMFIKDYICPSQQTILNKEEMIESRLPYDAFLVGSDQVWSDTCANFDEVFFLKFPAAFRKKKFSYAASFGTTEIPERLKEEYFRRLKPFNGISVREESGKNILTKLGLENIYVNCDPTLLLKAEDWRSISTKQNNYGKYILIYYVTDGKSVRKYAEELSKKTNMKVISIPCQVDYEGLSAFEDKKFGFYAYPECSPNEFLNLFDNAEYVITNSFHGTVFSLIFHKKFLSQISLDTGKINNRSKELLKKTNLLNRELGVGNIYDSITWKDVDKALDDERSKSIDYLEKAFLKI